MLPSSGGGWYRSLTEATSAGEQLEHFHAFLPHASDADPSTLSVEPTRQSAPAPAAVPLHTDAGLLIAMVPALYARADPSRPSEMEVLPNPAAADGASGFRLQRADGSMATVPAALEAPAPIERAQIYFVSVGARARYRGRGAGEVVAN